MATLLQLHFSFNGPFGDTMAEQLKPLAESINQEPGFLWKVWTESEKNHEAGGIYLFTDEKSALAYLEKHTARLKNLGVEEVVAKVFDVNVITTESNQSGKTCLTDFNQGRLVPFSSLSEISQILKISTKLT
ncbi:hypothetical protein EIMP300_50350 [Escherichia coli]|uniref:Monooxygenase n=5 Tax=Escherichia coli TaxID=562 RepID=A0A8S0FTE5_ECOLX|nr:hypothetical protein EIMP300_50350 [Escherichia coli]